MGRQTPRLNAVGRSQLPAWRGEAHAAGRGISVDVVQGEGGEWDPPMHAKT